MTRTALLAATAAILAAAAAAPASAIGVYSFSGPIGGFTFLSAGLLTGNADVPVWQLADCHSSVVTCDGVSLLKDTSVFGGGDQTDAAVFHYTGGGSSYFYFDNGAFDTPGTYHDGAHSMTVQDVQLSGPMLYQFNGPIGSFSLKSRTPITGSVSASAMRTGCSSMVVTCTGVTVSQDLNNPANPFDSVAIRYAGGGTSYFYFPAYALQVPGTYADSFGPSTTLTVSAAVPEPASWAMLIAGFGLTGAAARRRRNSTPRVAA